MVNDDTGKVEMELLTPADGEANATTNLTEKETNKSEDNNLNLTNETEAEIEPKQEKKSMKLLRRWLKEKLGDLDADWNDDCVAEKYAMKMLTEMDDMLDRYADTEQQLTRIMNKHPQLMLMLCDMMQNDANPDEAFDSAFRPEWMEKRTADEQTLHDNMNDSMEILNTFCSDHNLSPETAMLLAETIDNDWNAMLDKRIDKDMLDGYLKRLNYDNDIDRARQAGLIEGRNEKIEARRAEEKNSRNGDGMPQHSGGYAPNMIRGVKPVIDFGRLLGR